MNTVRTIARQPQESVPVDMTALMQIVNQSARTAAATSDQLRTVVDLFSGIRRDVSDVAQGVDGLRSDIKQTNDAMAEIAERVQRLEYNEEITYTQQMELKRAANKRVKELLGSNPDDWARYARTFIPRCYAENRGNGVVIPIAATRKGDYEDALNGIRAWIPDMGVGELKAQADERAAARRRARDQGYDA